MAHLADFAETTRTNDHIEILRGPEPLTVDGQVIGTCSITREDVLDYKSKAPTGEKLVFLNCAPGQGRAQKVRLSYAMGALGALGLLGDDDEDEDESGEDEQS